MASTQRVLLLLSVGLIALGACQGKRLETANEMSMRRMDEGLNRYGEHFSYMIDNAILQDMSVADMHFAGHSSEISGVGQARLDRMAHLLNTYGGTVRYETLLRDEDLVKERLDHVSEYLALVGVDMSRVEVKAMMSGGRGMPGDEAVEKYRQGTARPTGAGAETTLVAPGAAGAPGG
jgi:hypothetical protein